MLIRIKVGPKGQIAIPKLIRDSLGIKPGDEVLMEVGEGEIVIKPVAKPEDFIEDYCSTGVKKRNKKIDIERIIEHD